MLWPWSSKHLLSLSCSSVADNCLASVFGLPHLQKLLLGWDMNRGPLCTRIHWDQNNERVGVIPASLETCIRDLALFESHLHHRLPSWDVCWFSLVSVNARLLPRLGPSSSIYMHNSTAMGPSALHSALLIPS